MPPEKICFTAPIIRIEGMNASYIEFPFGVKDLYDTRGQVNVKSATKI